MAFEDYFSFQVFFIFLRESLEIAVIISILLTIVKQGLSVGDDSEDTGNQISHGIDDGIPINDVNAERVPLTVEEEEEAFNIEGESMVPSTDESLSYADNLKLYKN